jgi:hypothetical protein
MHFTERQNNTPGQVAAYLDQALQLTAQAEPPDDLRVTYFCEAVRMLSGKQILALQPQPIDLGALRTGGH